MGLRWMVSPSLPLFISLSSHPSPFAPHPPHSVPASFPQLLSRAGHNIRGGCVDGWEGGVWKRREQKENVYYGCDERRRQLLTYQHTVYVYRCVIRVRVCVCVCACAAVCLCDMPVWQSLATRRCCCSNDAVATTVWHLWRINIFHLDESYYPPLVVVEIQKKKSWAAAVIVQPCFICSISLSKLGRPLFVKGCFSHILYLAVHQWTFQIWYSK